MKPFRFLALSAVMGAVLLSPAMAVELKLASTPWPPFTGEANQPRIVIELVEEALHRAKLTDTMTIVPEGTLTAQLKEKKFDGSPALWRDADREAFLFYSAPILENRLVLVGKKGADVSAINLGALKGKRVGIVTGYAYGDEITKASGTVFVKGASHQENLEKLMKGELDFLLVEDLLMQHLLSNQPEAAGKLEVGTLPLVKRTVHFGIRKDFPNAEQIIRDFNSKLTGLLADGTYNRILQINWIQADVDGDGKMELIPRSNQVGKAPPSQKYSVFYSSDQAEAPRYWVDGHAYSDWSHVPSQYKADELARREKSNPLMKLKF